MNYLDSNIQTVSRI